MRRIFGGARELWDTMGLSEAGDVEFVRRLQNVRAATDRLIGKEEEVEAVAAVEAYAAVKRGGAAWLENVAGSFKSYIDRVVQPRYGLVVHDVCAHRSGAGWAVQFEAWVYRENKGRHAIRLALCQKFLIQMKHGIRDVDAAAQARYEERGRLIFRNIAFRGAAIGSRLRVRFGGSESGDLWRPLPEADESGRIRTDIFLSDAELERFSGGEDILEMNVHGELLGTRRPAEIAHVRFVDETGLSVVSDVDDTVKVTEVFAGKDIVARKTFFEEYSAVSGMPELYRGWARAVPNTSFHFVSNSPPELLEPLREFLRHEGFPFAPLHLRPLFGKDRADFKARSIEAILQQYPRRRFILVGDSGEHDPTMCADLMRAYPKQVVYILIREVIPSRSVDAAVFDGLDPGKWQVFKDPSEVNFRVDQFP